METKIRKGLSAFFAISLTSFTAVFTPSALAAPLDPATIPKYVNQLPILPAFAPAAVFDAATGGIAHRYTVDVAETMQQILPPGFPATKVWAYGGLVQTPNGSAFNRWAPSATFEAQRNVPAIVSWQNNITTPHLFAIDATLHWANPNNLAHPVAPFPAYPPGDSMVQSPVPIVTHLHGAEVDSFNDGHPEAWFTANGLVGAAYHSVEPLVGGAVYRYPNTQPATTLWYHDHTLGMTRLNVLGSLAGFYLLRDANDKIAPLLPKGKYEIVLVIQDRTFNDDGSLAFPNVGVNPDIHPYWQPEFFGDTILVNGKAWPNLNVEPRQYRFRVVNASNARFYNLDIINGPKPKAVQIGSDGGYLPAAVSLGALLLAPGERADVLVDFSGIAVGTKIVLTNNAPAPYPGGNIPNPATEGRVMQFTVVAGTTATPAKLPAKLNNIQKLTPDMPDRVVSLHEMMGPNGPTMGMLNGQMWDGAVSETPRIGTTEDWLIANTTGDTHPIHLHLIQFQTINRQAFNVNQYVVDWEALNGMTPLMHPTVTLSPKNYLTGLRISPDGNEKGWKDTVRSNPGEVLRIRVRLAPQEAIVAGAGVNLFTFDPTQGPGYVWHCHILEHEDNEMMRPMTLTP